MTSVWLLLGVVLVVQGKVVHKKKGELPKFLEWPEQYTVSAERMSLTDDVVEDYKMWTTSKKSRIDYNEGYVKSIVKRNDRREKYSIHPEMDDYNENEIVCKLITSGRIELETILPEETVSYTNVGKEKLNDQDTIKFTYDYIDDTTDYRNTIWAAYDHSASIWIPVRYEALEFNVWRSFKEKHELWNFFKFSANFSHNVFKEDSKYNCTEEEESELSKTLYKNLLLANPDKDHHVEHVFKAFKKDFAKKYSNKNEHKRRKSIFKKNMRRVISHNRRNLGYKLTLNHFSDKTPEELTKYMGLKRRPVGKVGNIPFPYDEEKIKGMGDELPREYDARLLGLVSSVKNQEDCGACWTFGTTAAVEGALARTNGGKLMALSNQALIDCAWQFGGSGCDGGSDNSAYEWMMEYGLPTESEYGTYLNQDGICKIDNMTKIYPIKGYTDVPPLGVDAMKIALINHGPLSVSVHATDNFKLYASGIFYDTACDQLQLDHEITLVGYGEKYGDTFWIVKNSWGPNWGIGGYAFISARDNVCGIATEPTYVVF